MRVNLKIATKIAKEKAKIEAFRKIHEIGKLLCCKKSGESLQVKRKLNMFLQYVILIKN